MSGGLHIGGERPLDEIRDEANAYQRSAADPENSAWVSANAGTGKTYVLVLRVLRLLLSGATAESILCLTFTKAAAAEMSNRLLARLSEWAAMSDDALTVELRNLLGREPSEEERGTARCLFARILDAPGGLKITTIHAFCDRVLRRFPLEAGVPPSFTVLTDEERAAAIEEAVSHVLERAARESETTLGQALTTVVANAAEAKFHQLILAIITRRDDLMKLIGAQYTDDPFDGIEAELRASLDVNDGDTEDTLLSAQASVLADTQITSAIAVLNEGKATDQKLASALAGARDKTDADRCVALAAALLTKDLEPRSDRYITKAIREGQPAVVALLDEARDAFATLEVRRRALAVTLASCALLRLANAVIQHYEEAKLQRNAVDFDGLIARTSALFSLSEASDWVLFRLDAKLLHILVDEAQDTSPAQWELIRGLTSEFFATDAEHDEHQRTLFAVGDEKQSIYRFQGADPRQFIEIGRDYSQRAYQARRSWIEAPLSLSFRSTRAILDSVDRVFADRDKTPGLTAEPKPIRHFAHREGAGGRIEIWPVIKAEKQDSAPVWEPFAEAGSTTPPANQLAARIAGQIRHWLDTGEMLASQNRPIRPSDILILVRKRAPFAAPMIRALKSAGIPVAGADRMRLTEQLAVMDLMALGEAMLLPEDDLTLAALLKSPVFRLSEDELFALAYDRGGSLWAALEEKAADNPRFTEVHQSLTLWREEALRALPYDFYAQRLESDGLRRRLLDRLGPDAADAIGEFLNLALAYETNETPTLQGFLQWLRKANPEIKRDMEAERDEVRVMTVHGSKGLEANIVFLADSCSMQTAGRTQIINIPPARPASALPHELLVWPLPKSKIIPAIRQAREAESRAESDEYQRLLYVAMTRARDRLYVAGFEGLRPRQAACWYNLISDTLDGQLGETHDFAGNSVLGADYAQTAEVVVPRRKTTTLEISPAPDWSAANDSDRQPPIIFNPSRLDLPHGAAPAQVQDQGRPRSAALLRGHATHRLLELLPQFHQDSWEKTALAYLTTEAKSLGEQDRMDLFRDVETILRHPEFAALFGPDSRAEVPFYADYEILSGEKPVCISGQIDRLVLTSESLLILDYKTGMNIPGNTEATPDAYLAQLAAYKLAMRQIEPEKTIKTAILWTESPILMPIEGHLVKRGAARLHEAVLKCMS